MKMKYKKLRNKLFKKWKKKYFAKPCSKFYKTWNAFKKDFESTQGHLIGQGCLFNQDKIFKEFF